MGNLSPYVEIPRPGGEPGLAVNPLKEAVNGFHVVSDPLTVTLTAAGTVGSEDELEFLIDSNGHFDWTSIVGTQTFGTPAYFIEFFDTGRQRKLQNRPVSSDNVVGTGQRLFKLPEPYFLNVGDGMRVVTAKVRNLLFAGNITLRMALYGRRFYVHDAAPAVALELNRRWGGGERAYSYFLSPQEYPVDGTPPVVGAGGTTQFTFKADSDADTDIHKLMVSSTGSFTFTLRERSTNRLLMTDAVLGSLGMGSAQFPFYYADTLLLERDKELVMDIVNTSGANNRIAVTLAGRLLRYER